jgi:hypothetical protein
MGKIEHRWFYTSPLERFGERRGDPLGFRPIADEIADALVPGLSNGTQDGRWLTIVCWILRLVQPNVRNCGSSKKDREEEIIVGPWRTSIKQSNWILNWRRYI